MPILPTKESMLTSAMPDPLSISKIQTSPEAEDTRTNNTIITTDYYDELESHSDDTFIPIQQLLQHCNEKE